MSVASPTSGVSADEYYKAALGVKNVEYYLKYFSRFDAQGVSATWNWPSFFVTFYWLLYRKMWLLALGFFLLPIPLTFIEILLMPVSEAAANTITFAYLAGIFIAVPMYANAFYYRHVNAKIAKVKKQTNDEATRLRMLADDGGTSGIILFIILAFVVISIIGILASIAIPSYQNYITSAKVNSGIVVAEVYKNNVEVYVMQNGSLPMTIDDIGGLEQSYYENLRSVSMIDDGIIKITFAGDLVVDGKSLFYIPSIENEGEVIWQCKSLDISPGLLPAHCRD